MNHVNLASLRNDPKLGVLASLQIASVALQLGHKVFPKARLFAASNVIDALTLLLAPSTIELADVHQAVATGLSEQKIDQGRRCADMCNPLPEREDVPSQSSSD